MPRRVLLVDDNLAVQKLIELTLRKEGFEVTPVDNALSALDFALKNPPEIILADYNLEGMSVFTFVEKIRQKQRLSEIPIVLLINSTESYNPAQLQSAGVQAYLKKPIDSKELTRQVKIQTGTAETVVMDLKSLPNQGETSLSEHFSDPGVDAIKIEELLGWSSPGTLNPEMTQQMRVDQTIAAPPRSAAEELLSSPSQEPEEIAPESSDMLEETQYFQIPPVTEPTTFESTAAPSQMEAPAELLPEAPLEEAPASHEIFGKRAEEKEEEKYEDKPDEEPQFLIPPSITDDSENLKPAPDTRSPLPASQEIESAIHKNVSEVIEKVAWEILPSHIESAMTKEALTAIVEKIVWEVVPALAEIEIKKEIKRLQAEENEPPST